MHEPESTADRTARLLRLATSLIRQAKEGRSTSALREHLEIAIMMSPISSEEGRDLLAQFDNAVSAIRDGDVRK